MYDNLTPIAYNLGSVSFIGGDTTYDIPLPPGARFARVLDVIVQVTTGLTNITTPAKVLVGVAADPDAMASMTLGTPAAGAIVNMRTYPGSNLGLYSADGALGDVAALRVSVIDTTGTGSAGAGDVTVVIGYDWIDAELPA